MVRYSSHRRVAMRTELKYLVSAEDRITLRRLWDPFLKPNRFPNYPVSSIYYDNLEFEHYREKVEGLSERLKLRFRAYHYDLLRAQKGLLEIKQRVGEKFSKRKYPFQVK